MAQLIKTAQTKIITQANGEICLSITLEPIVIEVNINHDGGIVTKPVVKDESKTDFEIPSFEALPRIKFGK